MKVQTRHAPLFTLPLALSLALGGCVKRKGASSIHPEQSPAQRQSRLLVALGKLPGWNVEKARVSPQREVLVLRKKSLTPHAAILLVDSAPSAKDGSEVAVQIRIDARRRIRQSDHPRVLEAINIHHNQNWAGTFFVDPSGALLGQWTLNLPDRALDLAFIRDAVLRLVTSWEELHAALERTKIPLDPAV